MEEKNFEHEKINNLKEMLEKTKEKYSNNIAYKIKNNDKTYTTFTHMEV